jgi:type VI secretion system secreted protein Hcp
MAESVSLFLKLAGQAIQGENAHHSLGRENSIECFQFTHRAYVPRDPATGASTGRRLHDPIVIVKRIDKASPLLMRGLINNQLAEGEFRFYRSDPLDGTTQHYYTVAFKQGRVVGVKDYVLDTLAEATAAQPPLEEIAFIFTRIAWTYVDGNLTVEDAIAPR